ncbi:MAG: hypothetical protein VYA80_04160 [Pseudomonadota bacterium]|nr:hypothetical protein [Pseudomonadota bacterium]
MKILLDIKMVTHCVSNLSKEIAAWSQYLDYELITQATVDQSLCKAWNTPKELGRPYALMAPKNGGNTFIRFLETGTRIGYWPPVTWGWNATEILVSDPDALLEKLDNSPIHCFSGPDDLYDHPKAPRAIQTLSPSGAMLYFTRIKPGGSRYGIHGAKTSVDRIFNVVLGGPSLDELQHFYSHIMGLRVGNPMMFKMTLAAQASNANPETLFPICVAPIRARHNILELDEYPDITTMRPREAGCIPGGMSMVSFRVKNLDEVELNLRAEPVVINSKIAPYQNQRVAIIEGPAGEWLELIEDKK